MFNCENFYDCYIGGSEEWQEAAGVPGGVSELSSRFPVLLHGEIPGSRCVDGEKAGVHTQCGYFLYRYWLSAFTPHVHQWALVTHDPVWTTLKPCLFVYVFVYSFLRFSDSGLHRWVGWSTHPEHSDRRADGRTGPHRPGWVWREKNSNVFLFCQSFSFSLNLPCFVWQALPLSKGRSCPLQRLCPLGCPETLWMAWASPV